MTAVTVLTDFGTADGYAAAINGVIAAAAPEAALYTASHDIEPGDVFGAALALSRYATLYPPGTVHLVVVDPGVGTARRPLAGVIDGRGYVAPDNGVLTFVLRESRDVRLVEITRFPSGDRASATFHGRDVFAPAAAGLTRSGASRLLDALNDLGPAAKDPLRLDVPEPVRRDDGVEGRVLHADRFGNLISNIPGEWFPGAVERDRVDVRIEGRPVGPLRRTYGDVEVGGLVALIGSLGLVEVSVRNGSAADRLGAGRGARVRVRVEGSEQR